MYAEKFPIIFLLPLFQRRKFTFAIDILNMLDSRNFSSVRFFVRFDTEMIHLHEDFPLSSRNASDWQISAQNRLQRVNFALHGKIYVNTSANAFCALSDPLKSILAFTTFAQFFGHGVTYLFLCAIVFAVILFATQSY